MFYPFAISTGCSNMAVFTGEELVAQYGSEQNFHKNLPELNFLNVVL